MKEKSKHMPDIYIYTYMYTMGSVDKRRALITRKDKGQLCDYASRWNLNQACSQPLVKGGSTSLIFGLGG